MTEPEPGADHSGVVRIVERGARVVGGRVDAGPAPSERRRRGGVTTGTPGAASPAPARRHGAPRLLASLARALRPRPEPDPAPPGRTHVTWRHALGVGLLCFAVWLLLDAPSLLRSAQGAPLGTRRTVAMAVLRPIDDVSRALGLSHVVGAADRVLGRTGNGVLQVTGPPPGHHVSPPTGPRAGARPGNQAHLAPDGLPVLASPTTAAPLRLLSVGDSLGIDFGQALVDDLAATGVVNAVLDGQIDTGLSRPDYFNWPAELANDVARYNPEAVVVFIGANDPQNFISDGTALAYGTPAWDAAYAQRVGAFMQTATAAGARVLWVGMPPMANPTLNAQMQALNAIYQSEAATHPGVTYFASWSVLSAPGGGYSEYLPDASGSEVEVREPDGTHLAPGGAERLSRAAIAAMDHAWGLNL